MWKSLTNIFQPNKPLDPSDSNHSTESGIEEPLQEIPAFTEADPAVVESADLDIEEIFTKLVLSVPTFFDVKPNMLEQRTLNQLDNLLTSEVFDDKVLPRLPAVVPQLMSALKSNDSTGKYLADQISRDPVLVGEVIRIANSAYYQTGKKINNLQHAIVLIGQSGLQRLISSVIMKPIFNIHDGRFGQLAGNYLWPQSERCAYACAYLARNRFDSFDAYLAGIVCNVGMIVTMRIMDSLHKVKELPRSTLFYKAMLTKNKQLSVRIAHNWQFPEVVLAALAELANSNQPPTMAKLSGTLYAANYISQLRVLVDEKCLEDDVDQLNRRLGGQLTESCKRCYVELKRLSAPPHA